MPRLIVHAGDCKSGSTAIQSVLQLGSWRFTGDTPPRLTYAKGGRRDGLNHHRLSDSLHIEKAREYRDLAWGKLAEDFAAAGPDDLIVISSERFEFAPPAAVAEAIDQFLPVARDSLQVVIYVRPHASRLLSGYAQNVRQGLFGGDLMAFHDTMLDEGRFHFAARLASWKETFGQALTVRPMVRDQLKGQCVVHDFLSFCAGDSGAVPLVEKIPNENRSLNAQGLAFVRELHLALRERNPAPDPNRSAMLQRLCGRLEDMPSFSEGRIGLPAALRARMQDSFGEDAARCDAEIFGKPVMVPALQAAGATDLPEPAEPDTDQTSRLRDLSLVWLDMMTAMRQQMVQAGRGAQGQGRPGR